ncbi:phosphorylase superfamily protein, partial [Colletotrichum asianum]
MRPHSSDAGARSSSPTSNAAETTTNDAVHWPADTLPLSIPRARIWVYGYNADLIGGLLQARNQNSVLQHGNDLKMKMSRSLKDDAPIIFVAHSLGGLVVKVALQRLHSDRAEASSGLLSRLKAVVFCGTPHRGSDTASWALIARHLAAVAGINVNRRQLDDLSVDSQVVGDFSSKLGWSKETTETIDADHREMVRQPGMRDISAVLQEFEEEVRKQTEQHPRENGESVELDFTYTYLDRFKPFDYCESLHQVPESHRDTCKWLWNEDSVKLWLSNAGSDVFWLHGYPGRGKSVFARFLVENLRNHISSPSTTIYFFCSYKDDRARTNKNLVSSLIHQLVSEDLTLSKAIDKKHKVIHDGITSSESTLWDILLMVMGAIKEKTVCIVIDALDELLQVHWASFLRRIFEIIETGKTP